MSLIRNSRASARAYFEMRRARVRVQEELHVERTRAHAERRNRVGAVREAALEQRAPAHVAEGAVLERQEQLRAQHEAAEHTDAVVRSEHRWRVDQTCLTALCRLLQTPTAYEPTGARAAQGGRARGRRGPRQVAVLLRRARGRGRRRRWRWRRGLADGRTGVLGGVLVGGEQVVAGGGPRE